MRNHNYGVNVLLRLTVILFGTFLLAFAYYHINFQNHLSEGGFVGLSLLGKYVLGISPSISTLLLDVPVLLIAWMFKGKAFVCNTFVSVGAFTIFYGLMERYSGLVINLQGNLALAALLSGVLTGLGAGIILRSGGASGGDDILSLLISEWKGIKVGTVFIMLDVVVLALSLFYMPVRETMYTVMAVVVAGYVITFTTSLGKPKLVKAPKIQSTLRKPHDGTVM
ncbi:MULTISPECIES: YitT family protein [unclassified Paenibacillus]|uniref:YitT family protein n=1 Tax=unclassified Paenibacillus TaxID=185978 RepID=UPI0004F71442|nr:YitT family protein [Paenibacillus sp. FSL H7-0737]AIQ25357.1 membrane protein [Paenibacillus sp. FSL H7-0737]